MPEQQQLPADARPITFEDLFATIGELYVQVRVMRQTIAQQQQAAAPAPNGALEHAVSRE